MAPDDSTDSLAELRRIYHDADALHAGWSCPTSTECCRFGVTGREPYVTSVEWLAVERAIARGGGSLSLARRALPLARDEGVGDERTCPLLDLSGRCSVYADRPLGCRTFFCDRAIGDKIPRAALVELVARVRALGERHRPGGGQGRRFGRLLGV